MEPTSLSFSLKNEAKFRKLLQKTRLKPYQLALQLGRLAASDLANHIILRSLVQYQSKTDNNRFSLRVADWYWHAAAALRNATGISFSCLVVMGIYLLEKDQNLWSRVSRVPQWEQYVTSTTKHYSRREYKLPQSHGVRLWIPFYPMFQNKIPPSYNGRRPPRYTE
jgi:hypothetical protein